MGDLNCGTRLIMSVPLDCSALDELRAEKEGVVEEVANTDIFAAQTI